MASCKIYYTTASLATQESVVLGESITTITAPIWFFTAETPTLKVEVGSGISLATFSADQIIPPCGMSGSIVYAASQTSSNETACKITYGDSVTFASLTYGSAPMKKIVQVSNASFNWDDITQNSNVWPSIGDIVIQDPYILPKTGSSYALQRKYWTVYGFSQDLQKIYVQKMQ